MILKPWQFSSFNAGDPNETKFPDPEQVADYAAYTEIRDMCSAVLAGTDEDVTGGACWYIDSSIAPPKWTEGLEISLQAGRLTFYRKPFAVTDPEIGL